MADYIGGSGRRNNRITQRRREPDVQGRRRISSSDTGTARSARRLAAEKKRVRHQVFVAGGIVVVMFASMITYMVSYSATHKDELMNNDYNGREELLLAKNQRGKIYAADGQVLAESKTDAKGNQTREYPFGKLFGHIIGYTPKGGSGVEQLENAELIKSDISLSEKAAYDQKGELYPGNDVYTTLMPDLQKTASEALGDYDGAVIVTEAKTGKILAMVSHPEFDPGNIEKDWDSLMSDTEKGTLVNRVTQGLYAPGSTFKIFDAIEFMSEDMQKAMAYTFDCPGYTTIDGVMINCYHWEVHGEQNLEQSFANSCNSSFATIGTSLDRDKFAAKLKEMMFDEDLPYDLPSSKSSFVLDDSTSTKEVMQLAIGQGKTLMTPLHLNMITAAIANGGEVYKPYVVDSVKSADGTVLVQNKPTDYRNVISSDVDKKMQEFCREVVTDGTASKLSTRPYHAAGKTGTAEYDTNSADSNAWFTGYAYDDDHNEIAITVVIEGATGSGGTNAVPVARTIMDKYFGYTPKAGEDDDANYIHVVNDKDGDGVNDANEGTSTSSDLPEKTVKLNMDTNGDGINDAVDLNGDGVADAVDTDGDGIPETNVGGGATDISAAASSASSASSDASSAGSSSASDAASSASSDTSGTAQSTAQNGAAAASSQTQQTQDQAAAAAQQGTQQTDQSAQQTQDAGAAQNADNTQNDYVNPTTGDAQGEAAWSEQQADAAAAAAQNGAGQ